MPPTIGESRSKKMDATRVGSQKAGNILLIGTSFKTSSLSVREKLAGVVTSPGGRAALHRLPSVTESSLLVTCNRVEVILVTRDSDETLDSFFALLESWGGNFAREEFYVLDSRDAAEHLFKVASGLDSLAVGEEQILAQVRSMGAEERMEGHAKAILTALFDAAIVVGRKARTAYRPAEVESSVSSLALDVAIRKLGGTPRRVLLIGTGKMMQLAASRLSRAGSRLYIATKRRGGSRRLHGATIIDYRRIRGAARDCDLIVTATSHDGYILAREDLDLRPRLVIDLGFPRNVNPDIRDLEGTELLDLDDLGKERRPVPSKRLREFEAMVRSEAATFERGLVAKRLNNALPSLYRWAESVRRAEADRAIRKLNHDSGRSRKIVETVTRRMVSKLLSPATRFVRSSDSYAEEMTRIELVEKTFMLDPSGRHHKD